MGLKMEESNALMFPVDHFSSSYILHAPVNTDYELGASRTSTRVDRNQMIFIAQ